MRRIPGTSYQFEITKNLASTLDVVLTHRDSVVLDQSGFENATLIIDTLLQALTQCQLSIPRNRIEYIVKEEMKELSVEREVSFERQVVSTMLEEIHPTSFKKIVLMGLSNAGKTCIYKRIFEGKKPWELMQTSATKGISYSSYEVGEISKPTIWDLGGQDEYLKSYHGELKNKIFENASVLMYVVDVLDMERYTGAKKEFAWAVRNLLKTNPHAKIYVLLHKIDLVHEKERLIDHLKELFRTNLPQAVTFFATSIIDESLFRVWSEIIREISPKSVYIDSILRQFKTQEGVTDVLLIEKSSGLSCGSTLTNDDEELVVGLISLLTLTIDRFTRELAITDLEELTLKTGDSGFLLLNVNASLCLVVILAKRISHLAFANLEAIKQVGDNICRQLDKLMKTSLP